MTYLHLHNPALFVLLASACGTSTPAQPDAGPLSCTKNDQCSSAVCLPDGLCSDGSNVAYVAPSGKDNPRCTQAMPCPTVSSALGKQPYIKVTGTVADNVTIVDKNVTILADRGAAITSAGLGSVVTILGSSQVSIYDLQISGATGEAGNGISARSLATGDVSLHRLTISDNAGAGVRAAGSSLTIKQSTIRHNAAGGVVIFANRPSTIRITNNFIYRNGSESSEFGGVYFFANDDNAVPPGPMSVNQLEFNTIVDNQASGMQLLLHTGGVSCRGGINASNNLIFRNRVAAPAVDPQTAGDCNVGTSLLATSDNPGFSSDYHLTDRTPASIRDAVACVASVASDIEGDLRPQGPRCDLGADEFKP